MKPLFSWRHAILSSGLPPTTRHVLLTLSCHMSDVGESCFPSVDALASETGLSRRAVIEHVGVAKDKGWLAVSRHGFGDARYWRNEYVAVLPSSGATSHDPNDRQSLYKSTVQILAQKAVQNALKRGDLFKAPCEVCGSDKAEAHHDDYAKKLDVRWLCRKHHKAHHLGYRGAPSPETSVTVVHELGDRGAHDLVTHVHPNSTVLTLQGTLQEKLEAPVPATAQKTDPQKRGSRLPADWTLPDDWRTWAQVERPDVDAGKEADKFRDYWHAKAGKDAAKIDWSATWRNWIRNARAGKQDAVAGRAVI